MIETYTLTEEDIKNANTYLSTVDKMAFVGEVNEKCFDTLSISAKSGDKNSALPSCFKVNTDLKSRYLMGAFVGLYLGKDYEREDPEKDKWLMSVREYDMYAGGHIFEQLNRMKNVSGMRDKCYDIQADYSDLKYRLESDIKGLLGALNDPITRLLAYIEDASSPEAMKQAMEAMTENRELLDQLIEEQRKTETAETVSEETKE